MTEKLLLVNKSENDAIKENDKFINYNLTVVYLSENKKPRNVRHSEFDGDKPYKFFDNIQVSGLVSTGHERAFGFHVEYRDVFSVKQNSVEKMYKTLKKINKKLNKYDNEDGRTDNFGTFVYRAAKAMGIKKIIFHNDYNNIHSHYDRNEYTIYTLSKGIEILNKMVQNDIEYVNNK